MFTPTRTPEGYPNRCPLCQADVVIEPTYLFGDATCPRCGSLLWFFQLDRQPLVFEHEASQPLRDRMIERMGELLGVGRNQVTGDIREWPNRLGADSLDVVEVVMMLEEEFDLNIEDPNDPLY